MNVIGNLQCEAEQPLLFRTCDKEIYEKACTTGSLWLRTGQYYQKLEDEVRQDTNEGVTSITNLLPLHFTGISGGKMFLNECTNMRTLPPIYIVSLHGVGIDAHTRNEFGGFTYGIKSLFKLVNEIVFHASKHLEIINCFSGAIKYQRPTYKLLDNGLDFLNNDVLRKDPVEPFINQDEWRVALVAKNYINGDPNEPLKLNVSPNLFYPYIEGQGV